MTRKNKINSYKTNLPLKLIIVILAYCLPAIANAYHLPLWQAGVGAGYINAPHYRGSTSEKSYAIPIPLAIYRGNFLKIDREEGIRGLLFESEQIQLNLSLAGSVPVPKSDDNARAGMPRLDPIIEFGPALHIHLWHNEQANNNLSLRIPLRAAISIGDPIFKYQGLTFSPAINFKSNMRESGSLLRFGVSTGLIFSDKRYHDYFYEVTPNFAAVDRGEYHANGGYSGSYVTFTLARYSKNKFIGVFVRYDDLSGSTFIDSPVIETKHYFISGIAFGWLFANSSTTLPH